MELYAKLYPDGSGCVTRKSRNLAAKGSRSCRSCERDAHRRESIRILGLREVASLLGIKLGLSVAKPLTLSTAAKVRIFAQRADRRLTQRGRKVLKRACHVFERHVPRECTAFITLTLSDGAMNAICSTARTGRDRAYQVAVSEFCDRFRKLLKSRGLPGDIIWVTEHHPARSARAKKLIPHVHLIARTALIRFRWLVKTGEIRRLWMRALAKATGLKPRQIEACRIETKTVRKSIARYMSKYLSKGKLQNIEPQTAKDSGIIPNRFYAVSNAIHKLVRDNTYVLTGLQAASVIDWVTRSGSDSLFRFGHITIPDGSGYEIWMATWFQLRDDITPELVTHITSYL